MANNKVQLANGTVLIDLTDTTATAADVASGSFFYDAAGVKQSGTLVVDQTYSVTKTLSNVTSNNDDTKVIAGNSFYADLTPTSGYAITSITVTMGGVDVTDQVFQPGTGAKAITANGTYNASADSLSGYDRVVVNVPPTQPDLGTKTITVNGTYTASDDSLDGYSSVTVNVPTGSEPTGTKSISISANGTTTEDVTNYASAKIAVNVPNSYAASDEGKVVSNGALVAQTSDTVTANGTVDTTLISSLTVNVPTGGGATIHKSTYQYTVTASSYTQSVPINETASKILFVHYYDPDVAYTTANTTYEGMKLGPALAFLTAVQTSGSWSFWRTNSAGSSTGFNNYGTTNAFSTAGRVIISANPRLTVGHTITVEVFYTD